MVRKLACLLAALATTLGLPIFSASPASASGGASFGCRISPGTEFNFYEYCKNTRFTYNPYSVAFKVQNAPASTTYSWSIPAFYQSRITQGCTSTSSSCVVSAPSNMDQEITVQVTMTYVGGSGILSSMATIARYCEGDDYC